MKLYERLPEGVTVDGHFYRCNFDFRNVIKMMAVLDRNDLLDGAREYNALKCVMKHPRNISKVLAAVKETLFQKPKNEKQNNQGQPVQKKLTDFDQDAELIRAAFKQAYNIDLYRDKVHWLEFRELLNSIPEGSRYADVISIRARPIPAANKYNQAEIAWLINAKASVALEISEEEQKAQYEQQVQNVFDGLFAWASTFDKNKPNDKGSE